MVSSSLTSRSYRPSPGEFSLAPAAAALASALPTWPPPTPPERCSHCVSTHDELALAQPLEAISPELISRFVRKVGTTWGNAEDLRRMTPRVLTLAADHQLNVSRTLVWQKLRWAQWTHWPEAERDAVGRFLVAEFTRLLRVSPRPAHVAHRWLAEVSAGIDDLSGFLTVWHDAIGPLPDRSIQRAAVSHLVELLTTSPLRPDLPATMAHVFPHSTSAAEQVTAFLSGPGIDLDLRRAATELAGTPQSRRVNVAVERLRRFRDAVERID